MSDIFTVYVFTNWVTKQQYVGCTSQTMNARWSKHKTRALQGSKALFHEAIRQYGEGVFDLDIIGEFTHEDDAHHAEMFWIDKLKTFHTDGKDGYNMTRGGKGKVGAKISKDQVERTRRANTGKKRSLATRKKISAAHPAKWSEARRNKFEDKKMMLT